MIQLADTQTFPFGKQSWYPHMMPEDVAIWERFIEQFPSSFDWCSYDVPVGSIPQFLDAEHPVAVAGEERLYKKKIDVVGHKNGDITIIELKPNAGASAVGQIKMYKKFYIQDFTPPSEPKMVIITDRVLDDIREFGRDEGVLFVVV